MPNYLQNIVTRGLRGELAPEQLTWDSTNASDISDEDLWREMSVVGKRTPVLVAYEDSYCGWYLAFAAGRETSVIFLEPEPLLDPDVALAIPEELVAKLVPDLARALNQNPDDLAEQLEDGELFINGANLDDHEAWRRVLAALAAADASPEPLILCDVNDGGRRYVWRDQQPALVTHDPQPSELWTALKKLVPNTDAEQLFRELYFGKR